MAAHPHYASAETAARSPIALYLRRRVRVGGLVTIYSADACSSLGYSTANRNQVLIAGLKDLADVGVIEYRAEKGAGASILVRLLK